MSRKIGYTKRRKNKVSRRKNTNRRKIGYTKRRKNKISRRRNSKIKNKVSKRRNRNNKKRMRGGGEGDWLPMTLGVSMEGDAAAAAAADAKAGEETKQVDDLKVWEGNKLVKGHEIIYTSGSEDKEATIIKVTDPNPDDVTKIYYEVEIFIPYVGMEGGRTQEFSVSIEDITKIKNGDIWMNVDKERVKEQRVKELQELTDMDSGSKSTTSKSNTYVQSEDQLPTDQYLYYIEVDTGGGPCGFGRYTSNPHCAEIKSVWGANRPPGIKPSIYFMTKEEAEKFYDSTPKSLTKVIESGKLKWI